MLDNPLIRLLRDVILAGLATYDITVAEVKQANQPTQQGLTYGQQIFLTKPTDKRYGFLGRKEEWDILGSQMIHTETQLYESTFQVNALSIQDPADVNSLTACDLVNIVSSVLQSDAGRQALIDEDVNILRIQDIRNPSFRDDRGQFEASPSFDFTVTHDHTKRTIAAVVNTIVFNLGRV